MRCAPSPLGHPSSSADHHRSPPANGDQHMRKGHQPEVVDEARQRGFIAHQAPQHGGRQPMIDGDDDGHVLGPRADVDTPSAPDAQLLKIVVESKSCPFYVDPSDGAVLRQDRWRGDPLVLEGVTRAGAPGVDYTVRSLHGLGSAMGLHPSVHRRCRRHQRPPGAGRRCPVGGTGSRVAAARPCKQAGSAGVRSRRHRPPGSPDRVQCGLRLARKDGLTAVIGETDWPAIPSYSTSPRRPRSTCGQPR